MRIYNVGAHILRRKQAMICHCCHENKLSEEFPHEHLTDECTEHPLLHCLRCAIASVRVHQKCSQCETGVAEDNTQYQQYLESLEFLFPAIDAVNCNEAIIQSSDEGSKSHIYITTLSGKYTTIDYNPNQTIIDLKKNVEKDLKTPHKKQCLLYNDIELETTRQNDDLKLKDYNIPPNSTIYLLVLLYEIPEDYDNVIFDLFWGYPQSGRDYLDASVLLFQGIEVVQVVDFRKKEGICSAVTHSGDVMDDEKRLGHHTIEVSIKSIPDHINRLVFTLSAWNSKNISQFPNPSLKFYDARRPDKQLCDDRMDQAADSRAIIMCCLTNRNGKWRVVSLKHPSRGNARFYEPLKNTIVNLISLEKGLKF
ncbi:uncharacterized protein LOC114520132 [Dendronephthya gigantea]|uniref:uncharacterized protein LOC114520132 n=1 Tax=Dendronephthya gigantea TaxID=151771 RepID=UPI00106BCF6B|nr:uncharacterized protein LOC114520132 [Dendronephthya gigantea]